MKPISATITKFKQENQEGDMVDRFKTDVLIDSEGVQKTFAFYFDTEPDEKMINEEVLRFENSLNRKFGQQDEKEVSAVKSISFLGSK